MIDINLSVEDCLRELSEAFPRFVRKDLGAGSPIWRIHPLGMYYRTRQRWVFLGGVVAQCQKESWNCNYMFRDGSHNFMIVVPSRNIKSYASSPDSPDQAALNALLGLIVKLGPECEACEGEGRIPNLGGDGDEAGGWADHCHDCDGLGRIAPEPPGGFDTEPADAETLRIIRSFQEEG